jgi:hypothetical protein
MKIFICRLKSSEKLIIAARYVRFLQNYILNVLLKLHALNIIVCKQTISHVGTVLNIEVISEKSSICI